jgi:acyl dehydratase
MTEQAGYTPRGMYFEEFEVGYEMVSAARTITETDVVSFAALTGDAPIFIGDTIHLKTKVKERKELKKLGGGSIVFEMRLFNQEGKIVQKGKWVVLMKSKS